MPECAVNVLLSSHFRINMHASAVCGYRENGKISKREGREGKDLTEGGGVRRE